jgi:hemerythrin-like domain-containing protein
MHLVQSTLNQGLRVQLVRFFDPIRTTIEDLTRVNAGQRGICYGRIRQTLHAWCVLRRGIMHAIDVLFAEHRSLAAVLHCMLYLVRETRLRGTPPRFDVLAAMVGYIDAFPERFHQPKEDAYLFRLLALRYPNAGPLINQLQLDHRTGAEKIRALDQALERYQRGGPGAFAGFAHTVQAYAVFHWNHMRAEEDKLIPLAREHLAAEDWEQIDAAFAGHTDPLFDAAAGDKYEKLFRRIVDLAPRPIGVARSHA